MLMVSLQQSVIPLPQVIVPVMLEDSGNSTELIESNGYTDKILVPVSRTYPCMPAFSYILKTPLRYSLISYSNQYSIRVWWFVYTLLLVHKCCVSESCKPNTVTPLELKAPCTSTKLTRPSRRVPWNTCELLGIIALTTDLLHIVCDCNEIGRRAHLWEGCCVYKGSEYNYSYDCR